MRLLQRIGRSHEWTVSSILLIRGAPHRRAAPVGSPCSADRRRSMKSQASESSSQVRVVSADVVLENCAWVRDLSSAGDRRELASRRLYEILLRAARAEAGRRATRLRLAGPELDDLAHQAAADALLAICGKIETFRGDCKFTTW